MGRLGRKQTVDSNLTAIHHSPKSLPTVFPPKEKKGICDRKKLVAMKILWLILLSSVKMGLFWCWQFNNGLCLCVSLANFSCAAGYDVCARRAGMEGVSYKWGKDVIFGFFFFLSLCPRELFFFFLIAWPVPHPWAQSTAWVGYFIPVLKWKQIMSYVLSGSRHP